MEILKIDHKMDQFCWLEEALVSLLLLLDWNAITRPMAEVQGTIHTTLV